MCSRIEIETIMFKTVKFVLAATAVATLVACGGGGGGDDGAATAGTISLKASDLDGKYACVGGPTSFLFLTTGACTDNQILQGTCTRTVTITNDKYFDFVGATAYNATKSWGSIEADEGIISATNVVSKLGVGGIDPLNGQKITNDEWTAANRARDYFKWTQWDKIEAVSDWMEKNYKSECKIGSGKWLNFFDSEKSRCFLFFIGI